MSFRKALKYFILWLSEIWYALRRAAEVGELHLAQAIIDGAGIEVQDPDLSLCYDMRGNLTFS